MSERSVSDDSISATHTHRRAVARIGDKHARLLGGPDSTWNRESFEHYEARVGPLDLSRSPEALRSVIAESGLVGHRGTALGLAETLEAAAGADGEPIVVVHAGEAEPPSRKDTTLLRTRPHLVLDGADVVASAIGASEIIVYLHTANDQLRERLDASLAEREAAGRILRTLDVTGAPDRFVSTRSNGTRAVVSFLKGGSSLSAQVQMPSALAGADGRLTIVSNAETYAHVALIARLGSNWFRTAGTSETPGSMLVTIAGAVRGSGTVVEVLRPLTFGELLSEAVALEDPPQALLLGGYSGAWVNGASVWNTLVDRAVLHEVGAPIGCGLIAVLDYRACGLAETARILEWMTSESSGHCETCTDGLRTFMDLLQLLCQGKAHTRDVTRLHDLLETTRQTSACGHRNGAIELVKSALATFADELKWHLRGHKCAAAGVGLPLHLHVD